MEELLDMIMKNMDENPLLYIGICLILAMGLLAYVAIRKFGNK